MTSTQYIPGTSQPGYAKRLLGIAWNSELVQSLRQLGIECLVALFDKLDHATRRATTVFAFPSAWQAHAYAVSVLTEAGYTEADNVFAGTPRLAEKPTYSAPYREQWIGHHYSLPTVVVPKCGGHTIFGLLVVDKQTLEFVGIQTTDGLITRSMLRE